MTTEDDALYDAEALAFEGTPLADRHDRRSLVAETREICRDPAIAPLVGTVAVGEASVRLVTADAYARGQVIRFAPTDVARYVAVHEVAHVVARRSLVGGTVHGPGFRAVYVGLVAAVYGPRYGRLLREALHEQGLPAGTLLFPERDRPVIDLDLLSDATRPSRFLD